MPFDTLGSIEISDFSSRENLVERQFLHSP